MKNLPRNLLLGLGLYEVGMAGRRWFKRRSLFAAAQERAARTGRIFVVVGSPTTGLVTWLLPAYGCGDICIDLVGRKSCPRAIQADITKRVAAVNDDSAVVFASPVLEYVADADATIVELLRMAGSVDNLFLSTVEPYTLTAYLYPGAKRTVSLELNSEGDAPIRHQPISDAARLAVGGGLLGLVGWAAWDWHRGRRA